MAATAATTSLPVGLVKAMRPHQWVKNVLVFAAPVAAGKLREGPVLRDTLLAFVCFCLAAGGTYLLNDAGDVESDRRHPVKRNRPIAAGVVPVPVAVGAGIVAIAASLALGFYVTRNLGLTLVAYLAITTVYTLWLKHEAVLDIVAVASGFVLRAVAGATATGVPISEWFFIVTSFGALFMVAGKRSGEARELEGEAAELRSTLGVYSDNYLSYVRSVSSGVVLVAYCMWAFESAVKSAGTNPIWFQLSVIPFGIAILRYALLLDQGEGAEPERLVLRDRPLLAAGAAWAIIYAYGVYVA